MKNLISKMDYTLLDPKATEDDIINLCKKAHDLGVKSVCVRPNMVHLAKMTLLKSDVLVCTVVSFPDGINCTRDKLSETKKCIANGADEIDMVLNWSMFIPESLNVNIPYLVNDVKTLVEECHRHTNKDGDKITLKVIVESSMLNENQTRIATEICLEAGADFIKTSTGYASNKIGAELNKIQVMKKAITDAHSHMKIKASGGIRSIEDVKLYEPYVDRFGIGFTAVDKMFGEKENLTSDSY